MQSAYNRIMKAPKYTKEICTLNHTGELPQKLIESLPEFQGHPVRHRCAACAYNAGLNESKEDISNLVQQIRALREENETLKAKLGLLGD